MVLHELTILISDDPDARYGKQSIAWEELSQGLRAAQYTSDFIEWHRRLTAPTTIVIRPKDKDLKRLNSISSNPKSNLQKLMWVVGVTQIVILHATQFNYDIKGQRGSLSWKNFI